MNIQTYLSENKTFWGQDHKLFPLYEALQTKLVPVHGEASTEHGELLRSVSNVYYDMYNNGGGNMHIRRPQLTYIMKRAQKIADAVFGVTVEDIKKFVTEMRRVAGMSNMDSMAQVHRANAELMDLVTAAIVTYVDQVENPVKQEITLPLAAPYSMGRTFTFGYASRFVTVTYIKATHTLRIETIEHQQAPAMPIVTNTSREDVGTITTEKIAFASTALSIAKFVYDGFNDDAKRAVPKLEELLQEALS